MCAQWYIQQTNKSTNKKVLLFNATGGRDVTKLLLELYKCNFSTVLFVPNVARRVIKADNENVAEVDDFQLKRCHEYANVWKGIEANNPAVVKTGTIKVFPNVLEAVEYVSQISKCDLLITGSLHLIGAALSIVEEQKLSSDESR